MGERHAKRLPKGMKPIRPVELVQIDTLFVDVAPTRPSSTSRLTTRWRSGPSPPSRLRTARCAAALLDKLIAEVPFRIEGIEVDGGSEFRAELQDACPERNLCLFVLPPKRPQLNGHVERAQGSWRYEFYGVEDLPSCFKPSSSASTPSPIASITQGLTKPFLTSPQPSTSQPSARRSTRLT